MQKILPIVFSLCLLTFACSKSPTPPVANVQNVDCPEAKIEGYWTLPDPSSGKPDSILYAYQNGGLRFCRMVAIYNDAGKITDTLANCQQRAKKIKGNPKLCEFDLVWNLKFDAKDKKYSGKITDPDSGSTYDCDVWIDPKNDILTIRGKVLIFGESLECKRAATLPDGAEVKTKNLAPFIPSE